MRLTNVRWGTGRAAGPLPPPVDMVRAATALCDAVSHFAAPYATPESRARASAYARAQLAALQLALG